MWSYVRPTQKRRAMDIKPDEKLLTKLRETLHQMATRAKKESEERKAKEVINDVNRIVEKVLLPAAAGGKFEAEIPAAYDKIVIELLIKHYSVKVRDLIEDDSDDDDVPTKLLVSWEHDPAALKGLQPCEKEMDNK
jgi:hypothetical protein